MKKQNSRLEAFVKRWRESQEARNQSQQENNSQGLFYAKPADNQIIPTCDDMMIYEGKKYCGAEGWRQMCKHSGIGFKKVMDSYYLECGKR